MHYAISDLHGCYDKYKRMLQRIRFHSGDTLYILGDVVDRGDGGIRILQDMMRHKNIIPFWGNHDYMAYYLLKCFYDLQPDRHAELLKTEVYHMWMRLGGDKTCKAFRSLNRDGQKAVLDYMGTFCFFRELEVNGKTFFLAHTVPDKSKMLDFIMKYPAKRASDAFCRISAGGGSSNGAQAVDSGCEGQKSGSGEIESEYETYFLWSVPEYGKIYLEDRYIVTGHTPTGFIDENHIGRICRKNHHIAIDCGAVFGAPLGCVCLDTLEEFYVDSEK